MSSNDDRLQRSAREGDRNAAAELFEPYRERLIRMVTVRMDQRLRGKFDAVDVVQEAMLLCVERAPRFFNGELFPREQPSTFGWLRMVCKERLIDVQRKYLDAHMRDVSRERSGQTANTGGSVIGMLVDILVDRLSSPTRAARRQEQAARLWAGIEQLEEKDREVLILRHIEQLTGVEVGEVLGISRAAVSKRDLLAQRRLRAFLAEEDDPQWAGG